VYAGGAVWAVAPQLLAGTLAPCAPVTPARDSALRTLFVTPLLSSAILSAYRALQKGHSMHRCLIAGLLALILVGCGTPSTRQQIVGRWQTADGEAIVTFTSDGIVYGEGESRLDCYMLDGHNVSVMIDNTIRDPMGVAFAGTDTMITTSADGKRVYTRLSTSGTLSDQGQRLQHARAFGKRGAPCGKP
jgi:hypothetical protein